MNNFNFISFKPEVRKEDLFELSPVTLMIFSAFCIYSKQNQLPIVITSIRSDLVNGRVSNSHKDNRAIDISSKGWVRFQALFIQDQLNQVYERFGALSASDKKSRACVWHDSGSGKHFHIQSRNKYFS